MAEPIERNLAAEYLQDLDRVEYRRAVERVSGDLLHVAQKHEPICGAALVVTASISVLQVIATLLVAAKPALRGSVLQQIDDLRLNVETAGQRPQ